MKFTTPLILSLFAILVSVSAASACLNLAGRDLVGEHVEVEGVAADDFMKKFTTHEDRAYWQNAREQLEKELSKRDLAYTRNNLAVALLHLGQIKAAIPMLEELERKNPGLYVVAANLGTAYELNGENEKALEWIKEGIKRNPEAHLGTEWLHVKILETKIALEKDPQWLKTRSVLDANFAAETAPTASEIFATDFQGNRKSLKDIETALVYQLHERLEFIKPPEPVVADLLGDLSRTFAVLRTPEHARAVDELARAYSGPSKETEKKTPSPDTPAVDASRGVLFYWLFGAAVVALFAGALYFFVKRRNYR